MGEPQLWRTANMSRRTCVVVKQMQSKPSKCIINFYNDPKGSMVQRYKTGRMQNNDPFYLHGLTEVKRG